MAAKPTQTTPSKLRDVLPASVAERRGRASGAKRTREHFIRVEKWLERAKSPDGVRIGGRMYWVLAALGRHFNAHGHAYTSHQTLAQESGASLATVKNALRFAAKHGLLEIRSHRNGRGGQLTNDYYMLDPGGAEPSHATHGRVAQDPEQQAQGGANQGERGCFEAEGGGKIDPLEDGIGGEGGGAKPAPEDKLHLASQETSFQQQHRAAGGRQASKGRQNNDAPRYAAPSVQKGQTSKGQQPKVKKPASKPREVIEPTTEAKRILVCWERLGIPGTIPNAKLLNAYRPKELRTALAWLLVRIRNGGVRKPAALLAHLLEIVREGEHRQAYYPYEFFEGIQRGIAHPSCLNRFTRGQPDPDDAPQPTAPDPQPTASDPQEPTEPLPAEPPARPVFDPGPMPESLEDALTPLIDQGPAAQDEALRRCAHYVRSRWTPQKHAVELLRQLMDHWRTFPANANLTIGTQTAHANFLFETLYYQPLK
jgi:hypothetical protein